MGTGTPAIPSKVDGRLLVYLERRLLMEQAVPPDRPVRALDMQRRSAPRKKKSVRIYTLPMNRAFTYIQETLA